MYHMKLMISYSGFLCSRPHPNSDSDLPLITTTAGVIFMPKSHVKRLSQCLKGSTVQKQLHLVLKIQGKMTSLPQRSPQSS